MARKLIPRSPEILEDIVKESLRVIGVEEITDNQGKLLLRLIISGISSHYFFSPDDIFTVGFLQFQKSPDKDELFKVTILRNKEVGVVNADTLYQYYRGELQKESQFKELIDDFLTDLIEYSQYQEMSITELTSKLQTRKEN